MHTCTQGCALVLHTLARRCTLVHTLAHPARCSPPDSLAQPCALLRALAHLCAPTQPCCVHPASPCSLHVFLHVPFAPTHLHVPCTPLHAVARSAELCTPCARCTMHCIACHRVLNAALHMLCARCPCTPLHAACSLTAVPSAHPACCPGSPARPLLSHPALHPAASSTWPCPPPSTFAHCRGGSTCSIYAGPPPGCCREPGTEVGAMGRAS